MLSSWEDQGVPSQVIYMRPAKFLQRNAGHHVPLEDRLAFQSATNEAAHFLLMAASQKAGCHLESIVQVLQSPCLLSISAILDLRSWLVSVGLPALTMEV